MNAARIQAVIAKDWAELARDRGLLVTTLGIPFLFVAVFLGLAIAMPGVEDPALLDALRSSSSSAGTENLAPHQAQRILVLRPFVLLLLMIPEVAASAIAAHSIVGEKRARTLEPLLATPITTGELMTAKCLVAGIPGVLLTWLLFGLSAAALWGLTSPEVARGVLGGPALLLVFLIAPLIALLALGLGVIASARASDARTAQQIGVVIILPLMGLLILQLGGAWRLSPGAILVWAGVLAVLDALVLGAGVALFRRETILTRWR
ncbi:ABC transporter permease subunit [soil metagenome]